MDILGILDPDLHENLCGSETLIITKIHVLYYFKKSVLKIRNRIDSFSVRNDKVKYKT